MGGDGGWEGCVICVVVSAVGKVIVCAFFFFFNDTATTEIYTLSLHDALPIYTGVVFDVVKFQIPQVVYC